MPTYEYKCRKCGHEFEEFQSMTEEPLKTCPQCKGRVDRLIGAGAGIIFKGSGFYETDYKKKGASSGSAPSSDKKSESGGEKTSDGGTEKTGGESKKDSGTKKKKD